jgi:hypothetical protein
METKVYRVAKASKELKVFKELLDLEETLVL